MRVSLTVGGTNPYMRGKEYTPGVFNNNSLLIWVYALKIFINKPYLKSFYTTIKLNLFNYVLILFRTKFACNSAFRNLVFRWK